MASLKHLDSSYSHHRRPRKEVNALGMECHRTFKRSGCYGKSGCGVSGLICTNLAHYCKTNRPQFIPTHNQPPKIQPSTTQLQKMQPLTTHPQRCNPKHNPWCNQPIQSTNATPQDNHYQLNHKWHNHHQCNHWQPNPWIGAPLMQCQTQPIMQPNNTTLQWKPSTQNTNTDTNPMQT